MSDTPRTDEFFYHYLPPRNSPGRGYDDSQDDSIEFARSLERELASARVVERPAEKDESYAIALHSDGTSTDMNAPYCKDCGSNDIQQPEGALTTNRCGANSVQEQVYVAPVVARHADLLARMEREASAYESLPGDDDQRAGAVMREAITALRGDAPKMECPWHLTPCVRGCRDTNRPCAAERAFREREEADARFRAGGVEQPEKARIAADGSNCPSNPGCGCLSRVGPGICRRAYDDTEERERG